MDLSVFYDFYYTEAYPFILFLSPNLSPPGARLCRLIPGTVEEPTARPSGNRPGSLRALPCPPAPPRHASLRERSPPGGANALPARPGARSCMDP